MATHFERVWTFYHKLHAESIPLISSVLAAAELASPDLEAMLEAHCAEAIALHRGALVGHFGGMK